MAHTTKEKRRENAETLKVARNNRTAQEQMRLLDRRLGVGKGAKKERTRLVEQMAKEDQENQNKKKGRK